MIAGALAGVVARLAMRVFALASGEVPRFSLPGTLGVILIFSAILGIPLALLYLKFWPGLPGLTYGLLLFLLLVALPFSLIPSDDANVQLRLLAMATFLPVPLVFGFTLAKLAA